MSQETPEKKSAINPRDAEFMFRVVQNMEGSPKVNWAAVAQEMGLKSGSVASVRFGQIKKKFNFSSPNGKANVGSGVNDSPSKVTKRGRGKSTPKKKGKGVDDDDEDTKFKEGHEDDDDNIKFKDDQDDDGQVSDIEEQKFVDANDENAHADQDEC